MDLEAMRKSGPRRRLRLRSEWALFVKIAYTAFGFGDSAADTFMPRQALAYDNQILREYQPSFTFTHFLGRLKLK